MQTFRYSLSLLNRHGFLGATTASNSICASVLDVKTSS